jgi:glycerol-3-phosphate dehydrogenase
MKRQPERLAETEFDLLIVGGGISGACLAHDAALRGLSVALVEKGDFGGATSAVSSKLLHGGIRYLQTARPDKVRESAFERARFLRIAPHLSRHVPFLIPTYPGLLKGRAILSAGMAAYELLCVGQNRIVVDPTKRVPRGQFVPREDVLRLVPTMGDSTATTGARVLYEVHMHSSERMTLAFLKSAVLHGAVTANYMPVERFQVEGSTVRGAIVRDLESGEPIIVRAALTANASGPWCMALNQLLGIARLPRPITHFSKGAHIVTRQVLADFALALPSGRKSESVVTRGGRHIFIIPWRGHSLIGTSDTPFRGDLNDVQADEQDVDALLKDVAAALPGAHLTRDDVCHAFAGLYPLTGDAVRPDVYRGTGEYQIVDHARRDTIDGLISVVGAKYTTARRLAERAVDLVLRKLRKEPVPCRTSTHALVGGAIVDLSAFTATLAREYASRLPADTVPNLVASYGTEATDVLALAGRHQGGFARLTGDRESIEAEVVFAVEHEMATHLDDVVFRRTGLGTLGHPGAACLSRCADVMAQRLGWSEGKRWEELRRTEERFTIRG